MIDKMEMYKKIPKILIVDDDPNIIDILASILGENFKLQVAISGNKALKILKNSKALPDLILLDVLMPGIDGYEVCRQMKADKSLKNIPIIFVSALIEIDSLDKAFKIGATDYIKKPFDSIELEARVKNHIASYHKKMALEKDNVILNKLVEKKIREILDSQMATIFALVKLTESKSDETGKHLERVQSFSRLTLEKMKLKDDYRDKIDKKYIESVANASVLHDIGKIGIEDSILLKPGKLTEEEYERMKEHTLIGSKTLKEVHEKYPNNSFIKKGVEIANFHHEKWDGSGYPEGLKGENIPLSARIVTLADLYDALRSKRVYKEGFSHEKTLDMIREFSGNHLDPMIVEVFLENEIEFEAIYDSFKKD